MKTLKRVLAVDDDSVQRFVCKRILESTFNIDTILTASNGKEALDILFSSNDCKALDLIVLDLHMPLMNGFELIEAIQRSSLFADDLLGPIVLLTSSSDPDDVVRAAEMGVIFMSKPPTKEKMEGLFLHFEPNRSQSGES